MPPLDTLSMLSLSPSRLSVSAVSATSSSTNNCCCAENYSRGSRSSDCPAPVFESPMRYSLGTLDKQRVDCQQHASAPWFPARGWSAHRTGLSISQNVCVLNMLYFDFFFSVDFLPTRRLGIWCLISSALLVKPEKLALELARKSSSPCASDRGRSS